MSERQEQPSRLSMEQIRQQHYEEIERNKILLWDLEEENRVLCRKIAEQQNTMDKHLQRIDELEAWCKHLQASLNKETQDKRITELELLAYKGFEAQCKSLQSALDEERRRNIDLEERCLPHVFFRVVRKIKNSLKRLKRN